MSFNRPINLSTSLHRSIDQNLPLHHPISVLLSITIYLHVALSTSIYCASFFFDACQTYVPLGLYVYLPNNPTTSPFVLPLSWPLSLRSSIYLYSASPSDLYLPLRPSDLYFRPRTTSCCRPLHPPTLSTSASSYWPTSPTPIELFQPLHLYVLPFTCFDLCVTYRPPSTLHPPPIDLFCSTSSSYHYLLLSSTSTSS